MAEPVPGRTQWAGGNLDPCIPPPPQTSFRPYPPQLHFPDAALLTSTHRLRSLSWKSGRTRAAVFREGGIPLRDRKRRRAHPSHSTETRAFPVAEDIMDNSYYQR
ncbi:hypothetical protein E2C01_020899 [Portunus trituberculatus]|uniref:Uncharacterized protein n=1 Tax=Portunus trituberculatus TaxID=210409 RepID=A0A5B7E1E2_PORTR|nr:hypothetical protein [Portunus trituberculatus]